MDFSIRRKIEEHFKQKLGPSGPIVRGAVPPTAADGNDGDFYLDTTSGVLYGPKGAFGASEHAIPNDQVPSPGFSHPTIEIGGQFKFSAPGRIVGVRYWRDATSVQVARRVNLWHVANPTKLGTGAVTNDGGGEGWKEISLDVPYDVVLNQEVIASVGTSGNYSRKDGVTMPISNGGNVALMTGTYGTVLDTKPDTPGPTSNFFVDVIFQPSTELWPVATGLLPFPVFTSKSDEEVDPPFLVVVANNARETVTKNNVYLVEVQLVLVTDTSDAAASHEDLVGQVKTALNAMGTLEENIPGDFMLHGFAVISLSGSGSDEDATWGDIWTLTVGASG